MSEIADDKEYRDCLTGFLGWENNTLNHILSSMEHKMKFAVIENEFGDVGIDENILLRVLKKQSLSNEWMYLLYCQRRLDSCSRQHV